MKILSQMTLWALLMTLAGCGGVEQLKKRAAFDFQCAPSQLVLTELGTASYGVEGCGKRGTYVCREPYVARACENWVLNSEE